MVMQKYYDEFFRDMSALGSSWFIGIIIVISYVLKQNRLALSILIGLVLSYLIMGIVRLIYFKDRPKKEKYIGILTKIDASSFPSAHAMRAAYIAIVTGNYFNNLILTIFLTIIALIVCYSRIYIKKHYLSDVIGGIVIGIIMGLVLMYI